MMACASLKKQAHALKNVRTRAVEWFCQRRRLPPYQRSAGSTSLTRNTFRKHCSVFARLVSNIHRNLIPSTL
jgi:hypothetical protein